MPVATGWGYEAGESILPARFVKLSTTEDNVVLECDAGDLPIGISQRATRNAPYSSLDDGYVATDGEGFRVYVEGEVCGLVLNATCAAGDRLKAAATGKGTPASAGEVYGARALRAGVADEIIEVIVEIGSVPA